MRATRQLPADHPIWAVFYSRLLLGGLLIITGLILWLATSQQHHASAQPKVPALHHCATAQAGNVSTVICNLGQPAFRYQP